MVELLQILPSYKNITFFISSGLLLVVGRSGGVFFRKRSFLKICTGRRGVLACFGGFVWWWWSVGQKGVALLFLILRWAGLLPKSPRKKIFTKMVWECLTGVVGCGIMWVRRVWKAGFFKRLI